MDAAGPAQNVAQATACTLRAAGVERVYGVPGEDHLRLLSALEDAGIRYVAAREESAACIMAAADAQSTGHIGVAVVTIAPGLTNAINGIANAFLDHLPLLVIAGQHAPERYPVIVRQSLDNHALVRSVTKTTLTASARIHQVLAKTIDTALAPPGGPVFLELREDVARAAPADSPKDWTALLTDPSPDRFQHVSTGALSRLQDALQKASHPALIVGSRVTDARAGAAIARLGEALSAPIFTSPTVKGLIPHDSLWLAGTFLNGNPEAEILDRCDLVLTFGLGAGDIFNGPWRFPAEVLAVEPDRTNAERFLPTRLQVFGDTATIVEALLSEGRTSSSLWEPSDVLAYRATLARLFPTTEDRLTIPAALADARSILPPETLVAVDAGFGKPLTSYLWDARTPNSYFSSQGLSTMGYALPAANALKLAHPDRPVLGLMGDGSLLMRAVEIGVAADLGIAPIYLVWVDDTLSQIAIKQKRQNLRMVGVSFRTPSCEQLAATFGGRGWDVGSRAELRAALSAALDSRVPCLIGARVDHAERETWFEQLRG